MSNKLKEFFSVIEGNVEALRSEVSMHVDKGNKAAGRRARTLSVEIGKQLKEFRAASVAYDKN